MTKKTLLIFGTALGVVVLLFASFLWYSSKEKPQDITFSPDQTFSQPTAKDVVVDNQNNTISTVNNFYEDSVFVYPSGNVTIAENENYQIAFLIDDKLFKISLFAENPDTIQPIAEAEFLKKLEIDQSEACKLNVKVSIYEYLNRGAATKTSRLSFCQ